MDLTSYGSSVTRPNEVYELAGFGVDKEWTLYWINWSCIVLKETNTIDSKPKGCNLCHHDTVCRHK
jgi:hypothetical protein